MDTVNHGRLPVWLLVLCGLLLIYQPVIMALRASRDLEVLAVRGLPMALTLALEGLATAFGIASGLSILGRRIGALTMTRWSLVLSAATEIFGYLTPFLPNNRLPGTTPLYIAGSLAYCGVWLVYLARSRRVRDSLTASASPRAAL